MWQSAQDSYLESRVFSADPVELVRMLYQAASGSVREARKHLAAGAIAERARSITKACQILSELAVSLDLERGGDLAVRLAQLYEYMTRQLIEANVRQSDAILVEVEGLLGTLSEGWNGLKEQAAEQPAASSEGWHGVEPVEAAWSQPGQNTDSPWQQTVEPAASPWARSEDRAESAGLQQKARSESPLAQLAEHVENPWARVEDRVAAVWDQPPEPAADPTANPTLDQWSRDQWSRDQWSRPEPMANPWSQSLERSDNPWAQPAEPSENSWSQPLPPEAADTHASRAWSF